MIDPSSLIELKNIIADCISCLAETGDVKELKTHLVRQGEIMNWEAIIRLYKTRHYPNHQQEMAWFAGQVTLRRAIVSFR